MVDTELGGDVFEGEALVAHPEFKAFCFGDSGAEVEGEGWAFDSASHGCSPGLGACRCLGGPR